MMHLAQVEDEANEVLLELCYFKCGSLRGKYANTESCATGRPSLAFA